MASSFSSIKPYLPSRKILTLLAFIVAIILIGLAVKYARLPRNGEQQVVPTVAIRKDISLLTTQNEKDSDEDGLKDWEETLWGTDPAQADSDSDGTVDGREIKENRNPLIANNAKQGQAPSDAVSAEIIKDQETTIQEQKALSATERLSRDLLSYYLATRQGGASLSETQKEELVYQLLRKYATDGTRVAAYSKKDIKLLHRDTAEAIHDYGNAVGEILFGPATTTAAVTTISLEQIMQNEDVSELARLDPVIAWYGNAVKGLLAIAVPDSAVALHVELLNAFDRVQGDLSGIRSLFEDFITAWTAMRYYQGDLAYMQKTLTQLGDYFPFKKVDFPTSEYGHKVVNDL